MRYRPSQIELEFIFYAYINRQIGHIYSINESSIFDKCDNSRRIIRCLESTIGILYMSVLDWSGVAASITATLVVFVGFTRWVIKAYLAELKPNGGESLSDKIKLEILPMLAEIKTDLAEMKGRLDQHLTEGDKPKTRKRSK
jgi:hypothetical protein